MSGPPSWVDAGAVDDLAQSPRAMSARGRHVLVAVVDGEPCAVDNACLHRGASLEGGICRDGAITCPSHWWRYDLRTGALLGQAGVGLATYPCRVSGERVEVLLSPAPPTMGIREMLLAHARAEGKADA